MFRFLFSISKEVWLGIAGILLTSIGSFKTINFVREGEKGIKLRFGRVVRNRNGTVRVYNPGFLFTIPFIDTAIIRRVEACCQIIGGRTIPLADNSTHKFDMCIFYTINDLFLASFGINNFEQALDQTSAKALLTVLQTKTEKDLLSQEKVEGEIRMSINEKCEQWGIAVNFVAITDRCPTSATQWMKLLSHYLALLVIGDVKAQITNAVSRTHTNGNGHNHSQATDLLETLSEVETQQ